ncbi:MAG: carboxypeptidase-like regulatory domain-containing protein, partial [Bacteroidetes bacterium]|nr:carboxypeptidase-like regulatory domain-containing protein [Bacteroidota bacterium]
EALIGANVFITNTKSGTVANSYGFYSISVPKTDTLGVVYSYLGYKAQIKKIKLDHNITLDVLLESSMNELGTVTISAEKSNRNVTKTEMGVIDVPIQKNRIVACYTWRTRCTKSDTITSWCIGGSRRNNRLFC